MPGGLHTHRPLSRWQRPEKTAPACTPFHTVWVLCWDYGSVFTGKEMAGVHERAGERFLLLAPTSQLGCMGLVRGAC